MSKKIRLLTGGSPCTHWSIAQTKNRETEPSGIGWELFNNYLVALKKYKPDFFLYENNKSMAPAIMAQITKELGVEPVLINSALVSAQSRQRLYWVGKRDPDGTYSQLSVEQPEDQGILLRDILESSLETQERGYTMKPLTEREMEYMVRKTADGRNHFDFGYHQDAMQEKGRCLTANICRGVPYNVMVEPIRIGTIESAAKNADFDSQQYRVYSPDGKSVTLCGQGGGVGAKTGLYATPVDVFCLNQTASGKARTVDAHMGKLENNLVPRMDDTNPAKQQYDCIVEPIRVGDMPTKSGKITRSQNARIYDADGKAPTLTARPNGGGVDGPLYAIPAGMAWRGRGDGSAFEMRDDQKANAVIVGHQSRLVIEAWDGKKYPVYEVRAGLITIKDQQYPIKLADGYYIIRKLTVLECMRLQTVPESYVFHVSDTQAYKMLGNGWTVDVIAHILSHIPDIATEPVEVLSMYDGMSCGHIALDKLGANVIRYHAVEIDKYAVQTTQENYPDTVQLGDAFQVLADDWDGGGIIAPEPEYKKLDIVPMTLREANAFVEQNHRHHGPVPGQKFSVGLSNGEQIVGVAIVGRPVARHLDDGWTLEVNRLCTDGSRNACSMLYAAAWRAARAMGYKRLVTYILESENGASLRAAGWKCVGQAGGLRWTGERRPEVDLYPAQMKIRFEQTAGV